jgi:hypothetical protein
MAEKVCVGGAVVGRRQDLDLAGRRVDQDNDLLLGDALHLDRVPAGELQVGAEVAAGVAVDGDSGER